MVCGNTKTTTSTPMSGSKDQIYCLRRGNDEQSIARHCLDGAVVWCPCFFMVLFWVITAVVVWWGWLWSMEVLRWKSNTVWWRLVTMTCAAGKKSSFVTIGCQKTVLLRNTQYYCSNVQPRHSASCEGEARAHLLPQPGHAQLPWPLWYTRLPRVK